MHERELQKKVKGQKQLKELEVERQWEEHERAVAEAYDEKLKEKNFGVVYNLLRDLDGADGGIVESLFKYKIEDRLEFEEEAKVITK